ncbi:MAG: Glycine cleavage system H protein [Alphaproteobacteria bacterium ADurb.Bin438]|nr:MAG: Glycine cleavage system H protein [Alphaproteobacteria bacterium ADurb.Bin438]
MKKYTETHEWIDLENGHIGISSYAIAQLGDVVFVDLPEVGKEINKGDEIAVVESVKAASEIYAPVSGIIVEVNETLKSAPAKLNPTNWESAWFVKIEIKDKSEADGLKNHEEYEAMVG